MIEIIIIIIIIFIITACFTIIQNCCYRTSPPELIEIVVNDEIINDEIINDEIINDDDDDDGLPSYTEIIKN
jgi:hypothetical protein